MPTAYLSHPAYEISPLGGGGWQELWSSQHKNCRKIIPEKFSHCYKSLGPTTDFPTWGSSKETENIQEIWLWRPVGNWIRIACECPGVSNGVMGQQFDLRPSNREGTWPYPSTENWTKDLWAWPRPSEQDPVYSTVSISHQEASINLLSSFIRGQTGWKPQ